MPGDARWRVVPVDPTDGQLIDGALEVHRGNVVAGAYRAMLSAAPNPAEDEALVERLAKQIFEAFLDRVINTDHDSQSKRPKWDDNDVDVWILQDAFRKSARAILRELSGDQSNGN